jgi:two-component sensor histidine kinase
MKISHFLYFIRAASKVSMLFIFQVCFCATAFAQKNSLEWLQALENKIKQSENYDNEKLTRIDQIYQEGLSLDKGDLFPLYLKLFDEYSILNFDSAYQCARKLHQIAFEAGSQQRVAYAKMKLSFTLLSSGMYKEVYDTLSTVRLNYLTDSQKAEYFILMARYNFDLADYSQNEFYSPAYNIKANHYIDSALEVLKENSFEYRYYSGLKYIRSANDIKATEYFEKLIYDPSLTLHERALTTSTYADIFVRKEEFDRVISLLCEAVMADIETSTKETSASYYLAILLFQQGDLKRASTIILKASADAQFYGARQRSIQVNSQVPLIMEKLAVVEMERRNISRYAIIVTSIFLALAVLVFVIIRQIRKLRVQKNVINQKNDSLQNLLLEKDSLIEEKEWLRKEIHHRVKNNLQTVMSLLKSQSAFLKDDALQAILDSQHRIYSMSLIHQKLYQSENVSTLDMAIYIPELVNYLRDSFDPEHRIRFITEIDSIVLNVSQAVPLGIILTEAISNAMKYAFPDGAFGVINVKTNTLPSNLVLLVVADNGIGLPEGFDTNNKNSLGIRLINGLSKDIEAKLNIESSQGTTISLEFEVA